MTICSLILAAGESLRFNSKTPKQYTYYINDIVINHSIKKFSEIKEIKKIFIAINKKNFSKYKNLIIKNKKIVFLSGGNSRRQSVIQSISKIHKFKNILIHDAARPDFSKELIFKLIKYRNKFDCVIPVIKASDTILFKKNIIDRSKVNLIQTPQMFNLKLLKDLHKKNKLELTDDSSIFFYNKKKIKIIKGEFENKKLTFSKDLTQKQKYGIGYDIHQLQTGYPLFIGGLKIKSSYGSVGHSDGDSVLHALIDSLLGAAKLGDIGMYFPNNKKNLGIRSTVLLKKIIQILGKMNLKVSSIDLNIIIQSPNLQKYKNKIKHNIAKICKIKSSLVNIKAKTTDRLGIIGKNKAIAAEVISTVENV